MFCPKCGEKIPDGVAFCPKCGNKFAADSSPTKAVTAHIETPTKAPTSHAVPSPAKPAISVPSTRSTPTSSSRWPLALSPSSWPLCRGSRLPPAIFKHPSTSPMAPTTSPVSLAAIARLARHIALSPVTPCWSWVTMPIRCRRMAAAA